MSNATAAGTLAYLEMLGRKAVEHETTAVELARGSAMGRTHGEIFEINRARRLAAQQASAFLVDVRCAYRAVLNGADPVAATSGLAARAPERFASFCAVLGAIASGAAECHPRVLAAATRA